MAAGAAGVGGAGAVAALTGASWPTVAAGAAEVGPGLVPALLALAGIRSAGGPQSPLARATGSVRKPGGRDDRGRAPVRPVVVPASHRLAPFRGAPWPLPIS
jgi:hypothetical protein